MNSIFVRDETLTLWSAAFGTYLRFCNAYLAAYPSMRDEYRLAIDNIQLYRQGEHDQYSPAEAIGHHLFAFYAQGLFDLKGNESPLTRLYEVSNMQERRGIIDFVGRSLSGTDEIDSKILERCSKFLEYGLTVVEEKQDPDAVEEFTAFDSWLRAESISAECRLTMTKRVLTLNGKTRSDSIIVDSLEKLLVVNVPLVVECFALLVAKGVSKNSFYISKEEATAILQTGFASSDPQVVQFAREAQDNLLRMGRFEFMKLGSPAES